MAPIKDQVVVVTGGASGIGLGIARLLVSRGAKVMIGDRNAALGVQAASELGPAARFRETDVRDQKSNQALFDGAVSAFGRVDAVVANAGHTGTSWADDVEKGEDGWRDAVEVMVAGVVGLSRIACTYWTRNDMAGAIVVTASMAGFWSAAKGPGSTAIIYNTVKGSNLHFVKSLQGAMDMISLTKGKGPASKIRANAIMPAFVWTPILEQASTMAKMPVAKTPEQYDSQMTARSGGVSAVQMLNGWIPIPKLAAAYLRCIEDDSLRGQMWAVVGEQAEMIEYPRPELVGPGTAFDISLYMAEKPKIRCSKCSWPGVATTRETMLEDVMPTWNSEHAYVPASAGMASLPELPETYARVDLVSHGRDFRASTSPVRAPTAELLAAFAADPTAVLAKVLYAGANASDVAFTAGVFYNRGRDLPHVAGLEGLGTVLAAGPGSGFAAGDPISWFATHGAAYAEFIVLIPSRDYLFKPESKDADPRLLASCMSGLTASIGLLETGHMKVCKSSPLAGYLPPKRVADDDAPETVLVTAAAGGTGMFAAQLAKLAGNRVIATCGGAEKAAMLKKWGVDVVVDYKTEELAEVLKKEAPEGIDLAYESVGGKMVQAAGRKMAVGGRLIVLGAVESYKDTEAKPMLEAAASLLSPLDAFFFVQCASLIGFYVVSYFRGGRKNIADAQYAVLQGLLRDGRIEVPVETKGGELAGVEKVADAVEYLHSGKSKGKVVVKMG
ncbi:hypothetical protein DFJ74DRAFT_758418 [Hyaloraphidium curvatum]|nr:hypothetical protein DFJ74DRAFT_758418 [Hyaloraphidium curvatum]